MMIPINNLQGGHELVEKKLFIKDQLKRLSKHKKNSCVVFSRTYEGKTYINTTCLFIDIDDDLDIFTFQNDLKSLVKEYYNKEVSPIILKSRGFEKYHLYVPEIIVSKEQLNYFIILLSKDHKVDTMKNLIRMEGFLKYDNKEYDFVKKSDYYRIDGQPIDKAFYEQIYNFNANETELVKSIKIEEITKIKGHTLTNVISMDFNDLHIEENLKEILKDYKVIGKVKSYDNYYLIPVRCECPFTNKFHKSNNQFINVFEDKMNLGCNDPECNGKYKTLWEVEEIFDKCMVVFDDEEDEKKVVEFQMPESDYYNVLDIVKINNHFDNEGGDNYQFVKKYVEHFYVKINDPACFYDLQNLKIVTMNDIKCILSNCIFIEIIMIKSGKTYIAKQLEQCFLMKWITDPLCKTYSKVVFNPPPLFTPENELNTFDFESFNHLDKVEPTICEKIVDHFENIICNNQKDLIRYLINYMYQLLKYPAINPEVFIILYSVIHGTGKNAFTDVLMNLVNRSMTYETKAREYLDKTFNGVEIGKIMIVLNEFRLNSEKEYDNFKTLITNKTKTINQKNKPEYEVRNISRYIGTTNNINWGKVSNSDRRCVMTEVPETKVGDAEYFNDLYDEINDKQCIKAFYNYIMENINEDDKIKIDNGKYNFQTNKPSTEYQKETLANSIPLYIRYIHNKIKYSDENIIKVTGKELYSEYKSFMHLNGIDKGILSNTSFGRYIKKLKGLTWKKTRGLMTYTIDNQECLKYVIKTYKFIEEFDTFEWFEQESDDEDCIL